MPRAGAGATLAAVVLSPVSWGAGALNNASPVLIGSFALLVDTPPNITFASIPQIYRHLKLTAMGRSDAAGFSQDQFKIRFNSDAGANYDAMIAEHYSDGLTGGGTPDNRIAAGATSSTAGFGNSGPPTNIRIGNFPAALAGAAAGASYSDTDILFYTNTSFNKSTISLIHHGGQPQVGAAEAANTGTRELYYSGRWFSTAAINRIDIFLGNGTNFKAGSQFALYGIP